MCRLRRFCFGILGEAFSGDCLQGGIEGAPQAGRHQRINDLISSTHTDANIFYLTWNMLKGNIGGDLFLHF